MSHNRQHDDDYWESAEWERSGLNELTLKLHHEELLSKESYLIAQLVSHGKAGVKLICTVQKSYVVYI